MEHRSTSILTLSSDPLYGRRLRSYRYVPTPPVGPLALLTFTASTKPNEGMDSGFLYGAPSFRNFEDRCSCINS